MTNDSGRLNLAAATSLRNSKSAGPKMKPAFLALGTVSAGCFVIVELLAQQQAKLNATTAANLSTSMHGEAFEYVKCLLYDQHARQNANGGAS
jgi:hypothetical protein